MTIKKILIIVMLCAIFGLVGCTSKEWDNLEWTNDNVVFADIKFGFEDEILKNVEGSFKDLTFQKVYVIEKNTSDDVSLKLLFVLNETGVEKRQEFINLLGQDDRIYHAYHRRDLPFATVDTRYIEKEKNTITVGETLRLEIKGNIDFYEQPFKFNGFLVKPVVNKTYTIKDFSQVNLKSIEARKDGWLYLELATEGYFELIKAVNALSRMSTIEKVMFDRSEVFFIPPATWQISDTSIAVFESTNYDCFIAIIKGIKPGKVTIEYGGIKCEIIII